MKRIARSVAEAALLRECAISLRPTSLFRSRFKTEVYVAQFRSGVVKVGTTANAETRTKTIRHAGVGLGLVEPLESPLRCVVILTGGRPLERALLDMLKPECVRGEWFRGPLSSAIAAALEAA